MFVIEREDEEYGEYEEDPGEEEHIYYQGRLLRCPVCEQPVPIMAYYDGLFVCQVTEETTDKLKWSWDHTCLGGAVDAT